MPCYDIVLVFLSLLSQTILITCLVANPDARVENNCGNTCKGPSQNYPVVKCKCDRLCSIIGDCCMDSPYRGRNSPSSEIKCIQPNSLDSVYTVTKCKRRWRGSQEVMRSCTRGTNFSNDPIGNIPVTNIQTGVTYKNYYCALCNNDSNTSLWKINLVCGFPPGKVSEEKALENIEFNREKGQWGLWLLSDRNARVFHSCSINPDVPDNLQNKVRRCFEEVESQCAANWEDHLVRIKCDEYLDPVTARGVTYRNTHCALCNRILKSEIFCGSIVGKASTRRPIRPSHFAMLLDFSGDSCVGGSEKCPCDQIWDPFFRKCRKTVSLPFR